MKTFGNEKTSLELTEKAFNVYSNSDGIAIYEHKNGLYSLKGFEDRDNMTAAEVNLYFEQLADEIGID